VLHCRFSLSTTPSVKPNPVQLSMVWPLSPTQVVKSSRSFWLHCGALSFLTALGFMLYPWSCLKCSRKTCHTEPAGWRAGISKRCTAFFTRCKIFCCLDGLRTSVTRALSMGTSITASVWPIERTTRRYTSRPCKHIPARVTCSACGPWRRIWPTLRRWCWGICGGFCY
jgi:hypothetical protein